MDGLGIIASIFALPTGALHLQFESFLASWSLGANQMADLNLQMLLQEMEVKNNLQYNRIPWNATELLDLLVIILLCCVTLVIILTPLVLIYLWVHYSFGYVKSYRKRFSIKKWITGKSDLNYGSFPRKVWRSYSRVYSKMIGFGLSILAYSLSSIFYMTLNFKRIEDALVDYFSFPFKILDGLDNLENSNPIASQIIELSLEMIAIVGVSILAFALGYLIGRLIVYYRFRRLKRISGKYYRSSLVIDAVYID